MSDPISSADMEGVVSRVRRLVSEPGAAADTPVETGAGHFVLTEAHRVDQDPDPVVTVPATAPAAVSAANVDSSLIGALVAQEVDRALGDELADDGPDDDPMDGPIDAAALLARITRVDDDPDPEPAPRTAPLAVVPDQAGAMPDLSAIPVESLRAVVADLVRAELQGALGERITRNVRKLVRREIHRVMLSQDLD